MRNKSQVPITPSILSCARCGADGTPIDWNYRMRYRVMCGNNHTSTGECNTAHRAVCMWNNAQRRIVALNAHAIEAAHDIKEKNHD